MLEQSENEKVEGEGPGDGPGEAEDSIWLTFGVGGWFSFSMVGDSGLQKTDGGSIGLIFLYSTLETAVHAVQMKSACTPLHHQLTYAPSAPLLVVHWLHFERV